MRADARAPSVLVPAVPAASAGRHGGPATPVRMPISAPASRFRTGRPWRRSSTSAGRSWSTLAAGVIAEYLRESGYPRCTAEVVTEELAKPGRERSSVGHFAADQLKRAG